MPDPDRVLSQSSFKQVIDVPGDRVDLPDWLFIDFIAEHGQSFEDAAAARQVASSDHNRRETPLFAESIARAARARANLHGLNATRPEARS